jgi:hypothetical protein
MDTNNLKNLNFRLYKALLGVQTREEVLGHQDELFDELEGLISFFENATQLDRHKFNKRKEIIEGSTDDDITQDDAVLQYFSLGHTLTVKECIEIFGAYRLPAIVHRLKKRGHDIKNISNKRYAIYKLN